jgi:hypothetical protein
MSEQESFKERVRKAVIQCAKDYKSYFVDYEYLICSDAFSIRKYYIVDAHEDNYLHLTGVGTSIAKNEFFRRCLEGTLDENDFSFEKTGQFEKVVKGTVRRKIKALPEIINIFTGSTQVEEDFQKNRIKCSFAAGIDVCTLGFSVSNKTNPMTLLTGNVLNMSKAKPVKLVLRKLSGSDKFDEIVYGDIEVVREYISSIHELVSEEIIKKTMSRDEDTIIDEKK